MASSLFNQQLPPQGQTSMPQNQNLANLKAMMQMFKASQNPQAFIQQMMANNPQAADAMNLIQTYGGDARAAFYALAKQKGIDPEQFLNSLQ